MRWTLLAILAIAAGCGHGGGPASSGATLSASPFAIAGMTPRGVGDTPAARRGAVDAAAAAAAGGSEPLPAGLMLRRSGVGVFFGDSRGHSLYTYAQDTVPGKSACNGECARIWPPLLAPAEAAVLGAWSPMIRDDGSRQWAWRGKPLYTYSKDTQPWEALGDRVGNAWTVALDPIVIPPGLTIRSIFLGRVLADARGHTLYVRGDEGESARAGRARCTGTCLDTWQPLAAPLLAHGLGGWSVLAREDGTRQWAYQGRRLYLNVEDLKPGDVRGDGVDRLWQAAVLEAAPPLPAWVSVQHSDMGEIFADARGFTLYTLNGSLDKIRQTMCDDACIARYWKSVPAARDATASGDWTPVASPEDGGLRWAYKGNPVYLHTRDTGPGAIAGDRWAGGVGGGGGGWFPISRRRDLEE